MQRRKECDPERVGCAEAMGRGSPLFLSFVLLALESVKEKRDIHGHVSRSVEG